MLINLCVTLNMNVLNLHLQTNYNSLKNENIKKQLMSKNCKSGTLCKQL